MEFVKSFHNGKKKNGFPTVALTREMKNCGLLNIHKIIHRQLLINVKIANILNLYSYFYYYVTLKRIFYRIKYSEESTKRNVLAKLNNYLHLFMYDDSAIKKKIIYEFIVQQTLFEYKLITSVIRIYVILSKKKKNANNTPVQ